jgi:phosphotransferase system  glucose/maltose/N-acetylglucosamine-specific IIC component
MLFRTALTLFAYAAALLFVGWLTYHVAPPGSNAFTALIISGGIAALSVACGVLTLLLKKKRVLGMIGIHVGLILPLVGAIGPAMRLSGSLENTARFNDELRANNEVTVTTKTGENVWRNTAYQTVGIGSSAAVSAFAFVALLAHRPKVPKAAAKTDTSA